MDDNEFEAYLKDRYEDQIQWYENKSKYNKNWSTFLHLMLIIFAAMTPILILIDMILPFSPLFRILSIISSLLIAIITPALRYFKFHENWGNYRSVAELLKKELYYFKASINVYADAPDKKKMFVERTENLISQAHTSWVAEYKFRADPEK